MQHFEVDELDSRETSKEMIAIKIANELLRAVSAYSDGSQALRMTFTYLPHAGVFVTLLAIISQFYFLVSDLATNDLNVINFINNKLTGISES